MKIPDRNKPARAPQPRTDMRELSKLIRLPCTPESGLYTVAVRGEIGFGPTDWYLTALLTFETRHADTVVQEAARRRRPRITVNVPQEQISWLPLYVIDLLVENTQDGSLSLKGEIYDANDFFKPPLSHGYMVRAGETPHLYLYLYTM
ncbi:hypothetical protein [Sorangium sp. So ce426]|uniref:hypothetical protein n=1 Tax=Sorangium sp. So ce426 TaxID=3133312 RepID=UPI003F5B80C0